MTAQRSQTPFIVAIFILAVLASFVVLNRWLFTDIGLLSFGRVWQFYISYEDFGFIRRALIGTLFSQTGLNTLVSNEYHFALLVQHAAILAFAGIVFSYVYRHRIQDVPLVATIALSPALIIQSGYTTGSLDIFVLILVAVNILYCRSLVLFCIVLIVGVFVHELFVVTIPAQLVAYYIFHEAQGRKSLLVPGVAIVASILFAAVFMLVTGATDFSEPAFEQVMEAKIPLAAGQHGLWSGFYEVSSSTEKYAAESAEKFRNEILLGAPFLVVPLIYAVLVLARLLSCTVFGTQRLMLAIAVCFPMLTVFVATDIYRWIGWSANLGLLLTLAMVAKTAVPRAGLTYVLLPFCLLAPLGASQIDWPFPLLQFVLERVFF